MTTRQTTADDGVKFSESNTTVYLTGAEIDRIESDPVLTVPDVIEYRARRSAPDHVGDPPTHECSRCGEHTHDPSGVCPDCYLEERGDGL